MGTRRARALGILAQPAEALRLLIEHQHNHTDQPNESTEPAEPDASSEDEPATTSEAKPDAHADDEPDANSDDEPESESGLQADDHQSLSMAVPPNGTLGGTAASRASLPPFRGRLAYR